MKLSALLHFVAALCVRCRWTNGKTWNWRRWRLEETGRHVCSLSLSRTTPSQCHCWTSTTARQLHSTVTRYYPVDSVTSYLDYFEQPGNFRKFQYTAYHKLFMSLFFVSRNDNLSPRKLNVLCWLISVGTVVASLTNKFFFVISFVKEVDDCAIHLFACMPLHRVFCVLNSFCFCVIVIIMIFFSVFCQATGYQCFFRRRRRKRKFSLTKIN